MKQWAIITLLSLITVTEAFAQRHGRPHRGHYPDMGHHRGMQNERIQLHLNQHLRGQNTIKLKQEIKYQNPGINLRNMELVAVKLVAKSKQGRGEASLVVGYSESYPEIIGGSPYDFHNDSGYTFAKMRIQNPAYDSQGKWQIKLRGNIKVKKVVVIVKNKRGRGRVQTLMIPMYDQHTRGFNVVKLKRLIKQQNPGMNLQNAKLVSVSVMAKSKHGQGTASLVVGQGVSYPATIPGRPRAFHSVAPRSYTPVHLANNLGTSQGKWQIELQGNIKVKHIMVNVKLNGMGNGRGRNRGFDIY